MRSLFLISATGIMMLLASIAFTRDVPFNWRGLAKERVQLKEPLLIVKGSKGFLGCGYINVAACDYTGEACAIGSGQTHEQMLIRKIKLVSKAAQELGVRVGMTGRAALKRLR